VVAREELGHRLRRFAVKLRIVCKLCDDEMLWIGLVSKSYIYAVAIARYKALTIPTAPVR
jgi:hypothetical protein